MYTVHTGPGEPAVSRRYLGNTFKFLSDAKFHADMNGCNAIVSWFDDGEAMSYWTRSEDGLFQRHLYNDSVAGEWPWNL